MVELYNILLLNAPIEVIVPVILILSLVLGYFTKATYNYFRNKYIERKTNKRAKENKAWYDLGYYEGYGAAFVWMQNKLKEIDSEKDLKELENNESKDN